MQTHSPHSEPSGSHGEPRHRVRLKGSIHIPQRGEEAFQLFTPEGERAWAHGWDPAFPVHVEDDSEPGTVFRIAHRSAESVWIVCQREEQRRIQYARVILGKNAGTVTVTLQEDGDGTLVTVEYQLTALSPQAASELETFAANYDEYLRSWETAITRLG